MKTSADIYFKKFTVIPKELILRGFSLLLSRRNYLFLSFQVGQFSEAFSEGNEGIFFATLNEVKSFTNAFHTKLKLSFSLLYNILLKQTVLKIPVILIIFILFSCAPKKTIQGEYIPLAAQQGVASWYGAEFHGRPTASGEIFNMYEYTCAHREYPFGTKLRIVNLQNRKEVTCTVNDRGPFIPGRDIDLSYASAKKIDLIGSGTATVLMEPIGRDMTYIRYVKYTPTSGILTIQVGAFLEIENALRLKQALRLRYDNVYINKTVVKGETFYRVRVGKFKSYDEAYNLAKSMGQEGYKVLITNYIGGKDEI